MLSAEALRSSRSRSDADPRTAPRATQALRLAFAGGGTGGHIVPGLHLLSWADRAVASPSDVVWFSSGRAVEDRVLGGARDLLARTPYERVALAVEPRGGG